MYLKCVIACSKVCVQIIDLNMTLMRGQKDHGIDDKVYLKCAISCVSVRALIGAWHFNMRGFSFYNHGIIGTLLCVCAYICCVRAQIELNITQLHGDKMSLTSTYILISPISHIVSMYSGT